MGGRGGTIDVPKTTCFESRCGVGRNVRKNWEPLVLGPALAMLNKPVFCVGRWVGGWVGGWFEREVHA